MRRLTTKELIEVKRQMYRDQRGRCKICKHRFSEPKDVCTDHDHTTGYIRALLCRNCNQLEGKVFNCARRAKRESTPLKWLETILAYWLLHAENQTGLLHPSYKTDDEKRLRRNKRAKKRRKAKKL